MHHISDEGKKRHVTHYLRAIRDMQKAVRLKEERIERLRCIAEGGGPLLGERVSGGRRRDLADIQQELDDLMDEYQGDLSRYAVEIAEGYRVCPVEDVSRYVCWLHYAEGMTWAQVGKKMGYSSDYCRGELCSLGARRIYEAMPHRWREGAEEAV